MKRHSLAIFSLFSFCLLFSCGLDFAPSPLSPKTVKLEMSCFQGGGEMSGAKAFFSDNRVDSVSVEVINSAGTTLGTATLIKGASSWTGSMNVTVSGSETLAFKARAYANALGTIHYYGESTMLINQSDVSVSVTIPTALWHSAWTDYSPDSRDYVALASSSDGTKLVAGTLVSGQVGKIWTSTDSGLTWIERTSAGQHKWRDLASSSDGMKLAAVTFTNSGGDYIYTSTDGGETWTAQTAAGLKDWEAIASSSDGTRLAAVCGTGYIYTSSDSGLTWNQRSSSTIYWSSIASSADGMKLVAVNSTRARVYLSTDFGVTWTYSSACAGARVVESSSDGAKLFVLGTGDIYRSLNSGATWTRMVTGNYYWGYVACSSDGTKIVAYDSIAGYPHVSTDSGVTWTLSTGFQSTQMKSLASSADGTKLFAGGNYGYLYTSIQ